MKLLCPLCSAKFDGPVIILRSHIKKEHPGAVEATRLTLRKLDRDERWIKRAEKAVDTDIPKALDALYRAGCVCGRSYSWHLRNRKAVVA